MLKFKIKTKDVTSISDEKILEATEDILKNNILMSMASLHGVENTPWINTAYYAYNNQARLFYMSPQDAIHTKNITVDQHVAVSIFDSSQQPDSHKRGLQMTGFCQVAHSVDLVAGIKEYGLRYASFAIKSVDDLEKLSSRMYIIKPTLIKIFHEELLGDEKWVTVEIER